MSSLSFRILSQHRDHFHPRLGELVLTRGSEQRITIPTPNFLITSPRGVIAHLSRDHVEAASFIKWINIPLETFLERIPPLGSQFPGSLSKLTGFQPEHQLLSISLRDPKDIRPVPNNSDQHVCVWTARGAKKITTPAYKLHVTDCEPDIVFAQTDSPIGNSPYSQKRLTKSLERSIGWLIQLFEPQNKPPHVFVHLVGADSDRARQAFSQMLVERLEEKERAMTGGLERLDDAISGYTFDLAPLRLSVQSVLGMEQSSTANLTKYLQTSLKPLPYEKPRLANTASSPFEVLQLVQNVGIDIFDVSWAIEAAHWGVALDFHFPVSRGFEEIPSQIGHNLYDERHSMEFIKLSDYFLDAYSAEVDGRVVKGKNICPCTGCSPRIPRPPLDHSPEASRATSCHSPPSASEGVGRLFAPPITRAYIHHMLHTHEMGAHAVLVMHNLAVADAFFQGIRNVLGRNHDDPAAFEKEASRFMKAYDSQSWSILEEAHARWSTVDKERGKGRLTRETHEASP